MKPELTEEMEKNFIKMGRLKGRMKKLEAEYKDLEADMVNDFNQKHKNSLGSFTPTKRDSYEMDKCAIAKLMGMASYKEHSTISKTGIEKGIGAKGYDKLVATGAVAVCDTNYYYVFRPKKK